MSAFASGQSMFCRRSRRNLYPSTSKVLPTWRFELVDLEKRREENVEKPLAPELVLALVAHYMDLGAESGLVPCPGGES